jgi:protease-4
MKRFWWAWVLIALIVITGICAIAGRSVVGKKVGVIEVRGTISSSKEIIADIRKCEKNPSVGAIVVHVQSPGGAVVPCQEVYEALRETEKPTVASLGDCAASGGYYIACACDSIVSNPGTITGSIGVIMSIPNVSGLLEKIGVGFSVVKSKPYKDMGSPYRELTAEERRLFKDLVDDVYDQFVCAVAEGRGLGKEEVTEIADGRIISGRQALDLGLVDNLGTLHDAKLLAASLAGISGEPGTVEFKRLHPWWSDLVKGTVQGRDWIRLEFR